MFGNQKLRYQHNQMYVVEERGVRCTIEEQDLAHRCKEIISSEDYRYQKHDCECAGLGSLATISSGRTGASECQADGRRLE